MSPGSEAPEINSEIKASYSTDSSAVPWQMLFSRGASETQISSFLLKDRASFSSLTRYCPHVATWVQQDLHEHLSHCSVELPLFSLVVGLGWVVACISTLLLRLIQRVSRPSLSKGKGCSSRGKQVSSDRRRAKVQLKRVILSSGDSEKRYLLCKTEESMQRSMNEACL